MDAYLDALRMLGRRELSEGQVRQRLGRQGHDPSAVDAAVARLRQERAIDDHRVADAIARRAVTRRGPIRVKRDIERAGIAPRTAQRAIDEAFSGLDERALIDAALDRRLRGRRTIVDERERARLYRYLLGQGFEADRILEALRTLRLQNAEGRL